MSSQDYSQDRKSSMSRGTLHQYLSPGMARRTKWVLGEDQIIVLER